MTKPETANTAPDEQHQGKLDLASGILGGIKEEDAANSGAGILDPKILLEMPVKLMQVFQHSRMSEEQGKLVVAVLTRYTRYEYGETNPSQVMLIEMSRSSGQDGLARGEYVQVSTSLTRAVPQPESQPQKRGFLRNLFG